MGEWIKSSFSNPSGNSVEVRPLPGGMVELRESDTPGRTVRTSRAKLRAFLDGAKAGEFDHLAD